MARNLFIFNSKKIPRAFLLALTAILFINIIELFVLPINFFTFRVWESLVVERFHFLFQGPFYPNMTVSMLEEGDMLHHTKFAVKKAVHWETDRYGYRKRNEDVKQYDVVVVGDSSVAGTSLTQEDMFSEQLEERLGVKVYPLAPADINVFLNCKRFADNPPKIVILESIEEDIPKLPDIQIGGSNIKRSPWLKTHLKMLLKAFIGKREWLAILLDRLSKQVMYHYIASTISRAEERWKDKVESLSAPLPKQIPAEDPVNSLFFNSKNISEEDINRIAERIKNYKQELIKRGIRFIFFPLPNREFVYREDISVQGGVFYFRLLIDKLRGEGMDVIDVLPVFKADYKKNHILLYHTDDTHWNPYGVRLAVDVAIKLLKEGRP